MIDEQQLRAVVREVIAAKVCRPSAAEAWDRQSGETFVQPAGTREFAVPTTHVSHGLVRLVAASQQDGPCVIEPHVMCDHCGYCKSLGH